MKLPQRALQGVRFYDGLSDRAIDLVVSVPVSKDNIIRYYIIVIIRSSRLTERQ